ncbi:MAG: RMD1 family protein, partial [Gammaproteobacteria bacterium]|nr:RMD1 family protein [Gammaproteobacteria bacterium]
MSTLFNDRATVTVKALFVGQRIDLRDFEKGTVLARAPLMVSAGASGCAVLFRYGVIVLFGLDSVEEVKLLSDIKSLITEPFPNIERDSIDVVKLSDEEEGISKSRIVLRDFDYKRLQIV